MRLQTACIVSLRRLRADLVRETFQHQQHTRMNTHFFHFTTLTLSRRTETDKWDPINDCHNIWNLFRCIFLNFNAHYREHSISFACILSRPALCIGKPSKCVRYVFLRFSSRFTIRSLSFFEMKYFNFLPSFVGDATQIESLIIICSWYRRCEPPVNLNEMKNEIIFIRFVCEKGIWFPSHLRFSVKHRKNAPNRARITTCSVFVGREK